MDFSEALKCLKAGIGMYREGWNAPHTLFLPNTPEDVDARDLVKVFVLHTAQDAHVAWTPSVTDLLAEDWQPEDKRS